MIHVQTTILSRYFQVLGEDRRRATDLLLEALEQSRAAGDDLTASYALRHLGIEHHLAGDLEAAEHALQESTALRAELGFQAGVAANMIGLTYIALGRGDHVVARQRVAEARRMAEVCGATTIVDQAREAEVAIQEAAG